MANTRTHDIVATVGTYKSGGEEKKRYVNCGSAFTDDQGRISLKLDSVPVSPEWSGWLSLYPVERQQGQQQRGGQARQRPPQREQPPARDEGYDEEDIPF
jgi:hypothetical protein